MMSASWPRDEGEKRTAEKELSPDIQAELCNDLRTFNAGVLASTASPHPAAYLTRVISI